MQAMKLVWTLDDDENDSQKKSFTLQAVSQMLHNSVWRCFMPLYKTESPLSLQKAGYRPVTFHLCKQEEEVA